MSEQLGAVGRLIEAYQDRHPRKTRPSMAGIAGAVGVTRGMVGDWARGKSMPKPQHLRKLAQEIETDYMLVLNAALVDRGYLVMESLDGQPPMIKSALSFVLPDEPAPEPARRSGRSTMG